MGNTTASLQPREDIQTTTNPDLPLIEGETVPVVVLSDYPPSDICEPQFRTGEWLRCISDDDYWIKVYSVQTKEENYIPRSHVAKVYHGWLYEGVTRHQAEELLQLPGNRVGSFLIRESTRGVYTLSVRHRSIKHYRIIRMPNNWYFISPRLTFQCLEDLVNHYSDIADGLCCVLTGPCLEVNNQLHFSQPAHMVRPQTFNWTAMESVNASDLSANRNSCISFGVQDSVSSYLSLAGEQESKKQSWKKKKWKSIYTFHSQQQRSTATAEEDYEESP